MADGPSIACPGCGGHLAFHLVDNLRIGVCGDCGGAWFGSGQLDSMVSHGQVALDVLLGLEPAGAHTQHAAGAAKCPLCNTPLQSTAYQSSQPVHASACFQCGGIFLDAASIEALDAASKQRATAGAGAFGHQGGFGATPPIPTGPPQPGAVPNAGAWQPPVPMPVPQASFPSSPMPPQVTAISSSLYGNRMYYQDPMYGYGPPMGYPMGYQQSGMGTFGTIVAADVVANVVTDLLGCLF